MATNNVLDNRTGTLTVDNALTVTAGGLTVTAGNTTLTPLNASGLVLNSSAGALSTAATTNHAVQIGNSSGQLTSLSVGTNGQLLVGATTADPSWVTPTAGTGLSVTTNATTLSYALSAPVSVANGGTGAITLTSHGVLVGEGTSAITGLVAGTNGQVLLGSTGADPIFATLTSSSLSFTTGAGTLAINITAPVSIANGGTNATSMANTDGVVYYDGTSLVTTTVGTSGYVLTSNGTGVAPTFQAAAAGGIVTLNGDSGSATGTTVTIAGTANQIVTSGSSATVTLALTSSVTVANNLTMTNGSLSVGNTAASSSASDVDFLKSRSAGVITSGDALGLITFKGHDGTGYITASQITSTNSGTVATNRIASDLKFYTHPDSTTASTLRMTIAPTGDITIASPDSGTALTISGGGLTVSAGTTTLTPLNASGIVLNSAAGALSTAATTNHAVQIGNSSGQLTSLSVGTNGQLLVGATTADPSWVTPTAGAGLSVTTNATTLSYALSTPVSVANGGTNATSMANTDGVVYYDGTSLVTTTVGTSGYVLTSNGAGVAPTFQAGGGGGGGLLSWTAITSTTTTLSINNGYTLSNASGVVATLPSTAAAGSVIFVVGINAGGFTIAQNSGQSIQFGNQVTTTGTGGSLVSVTNGDSVQLLCTTADNGWYVISSVGYLTVN